MNLSPTSREMIVKNKNEVFLTDFDCLCLHVFTLATVSVEFVSAIALGAHHVDALDLSCASVSLSGKLACCWTCLRAWSLARSRHLGRP